MKQQPNIKGDNMETKVYQKLARTIDARQNCLESGNTEWYDIHGAVIDHIVNKYLPSGSGIDSGCTIDNERHEILYIESSYHTMDENGFYGHWIDFMVKVKPSLQFGINLTISGPFAKHPGLKDYLYELFYHALNQTVDNNKIKAISV